MKMVLSIVSKADAKVVVNELLKGGYQVTKLSSSGGFLQTGTVTLLSVVLNERVQGALQIIGEHSKKRTYSPSKVPHEVRSILNFDKPNAAIHDIVTGGATCFVLNVEEVRRY